MTRTQLLGAALCSLLAFLLVCSPASGAGGTSYTVTVTAKAKVKGHRCRYSDAGTLTFFDNGTFTAEEIQAGTWTGSGKKRILQVSLADIEKLIEETVADELGIVLQLASVTSQKGKATIKGDEVKGVLKIKAVVNAPSLGIFGVKVSLSIKFVGALAS